MGFAAEPKSESRSAPACSAGRPPTPSSGASRRSRAAGASSSSSTSSTAWPRTTHGCSSPTRSRRSRTSSDRRRWCWSASPTPSASSCGAPVDRAGGRPDPHAAYVPGGARGDRHRGMEAALLTIDRDAVETIARLAQGLPHYAHMLGQLSGRIALEALRTNVRPATSARRSPRRSTRRSRACWRRTGARRSRRARPSTPRSSSPARWRVATSSASSEPTDVSEPLGEIAGKRYTAAAFTHHLEELAGPDRGNLLQKRSGLGRALPLRQSAPPALRAHARARGGSRGPELLREVLSGDGTVRV